MSNQTNYSIKVLFLLILFPIFYISCSKDEIENTENTAIQKQIEVPFASYTMLHKSSAFIENKIDLQNSLKQIGKKFRSVNKDPFDSISSFDFKIFTENITYVYSPKDTTETYSFYIEKDFKRNSFIIENLILKKGIKEKIYKAYIIKYFLKNGLTNPEENMQVTSFEEIDINNIQGISKTCTSSYEFIVLETKHDCYSGDHSGANQEGKCDYIADGGSPPYSTWSVVVLQNDCDGGGGGGTVEPTDPDSGDPTGPGGSPTGPGSGDSGVDTGMSLPPSCQTNECAEEDILANQINEKLNSSLSYEELIWLFDNNSQAQRIDNFLDANRFDLTAKVFVQKALEALIEGGEVDFFYRVIVDDSFKENECLNDIYEAMGKASTFNGYLQAFNSSMSGANLKFSSDSNFASNRKQKYHNAMAITDPPLNSNLISIDFNTDPATSGNILNKPDVFKVVSLIHEVLHAEMYRKMLDAVKAAKINSTNLNWRTWPLGTDFDDFVESLENKYFGIFDHYTRYDWDDDAPDNAQHQQMAGYYRDVVKQALTEYDPSLTLAQKEALSWIGLNSADIVAWQLKTPEEQEAIDDLIQTIKNSFSNGCN